LEDEMVRFQAKMSSKNQITLPAGGRKTLGVHALDRVDFIIDGNTVRVEPVKLTMADIYQSIPAIKRGGVTIMEPTLEEAMDMDGEGEQINTLGAVV
jgi:bifunctional DNA-binding transcriptional regulator/antitoxin component of YhaV-PrlF toxin-antitoxin module